MQQRKRPALANALTPVRVVRENKAYKVPRHPAPMDLRLDGNEGQPPPASLLEALTQPGADWLARYPSARNLEALLAARYKLDPSQVLVTAGGDDGIDRICRTMLSEGRQALIPTPSFAMLSRYASVAGGKVTHVPWEPGGPFPVDEMCRLASPDTGVAMLVTPNNPTGTSVPTAEILRLASQLPQAIILLDLAYVEFADTDPTLDALQMPNVAVVRTFSKAWGLASARVGYVLSSPQVIEWLRIAGEPYAVASPSIRLAEARLQTGSDDVDAFIQKVRQERKLLEDLLPTLDAQPLPSQGNFVFARTKDALWWRDAMAGFGIAIRAFPDKPALQDALRITCPGDDAHFARLRHALQSAQQPQAILFDMDGVLADVSGSYRQAIVQTAASFGLTLSPQDIRNAKAQGNANNDWILTQRLLAQHHIEISLDAVTQRFEEFYQGTPQQPGLRLRETSLVSPAWLQTLRSRFKLGIVTGRPRSDAMRWLREHEMVDLFEVVVCMEDAPAKPSPAPVHRALEALQVSRAWLLGDTPDDVRAARVAEVLPIGIIAPGEPPQDATQTLLHAGAARVLPHTIDLTELLP